MKSIALLLASGVACSSPGDPMAFTAGEIRLRSLNGAQEIELRYRVKGGHLRIDRPEPIDPAPAINLIDLVSGTVRIVHPHNGTWQEVSAEALGPSKPATFSGLPVPPPGIGPRHSPEIQPAGEQAVVPHGFSLPTAPARIGPDMPGTPAVPAFPARPSMPAIPNPPALQPGIGLGTAGPAIPPAPAFLAPGTTSAAPLELTASDDKRVIHGYTCTRHAVAIPREGTLVLWLADPGLLPPFHCLLDDAPLPAFRPWDQQVAALLQEKDRFPLLAELTGADGQSLVRWEVSVVAPGDLAATEDTLFHLPAGFHRLADR